MPCGSTHSNDLVRRPLSFLALWGIPLALVLVGALWPGARVWLWVPADVIAGTGCLANASRCGRLHCFLTGPLFLLGGLATLLDHLGVVHVDATWIAVAMVVGTLLGYAAEWIGGAYVRPACGSTGDADHA